MASPETVESKIEYLSEGVMKRDRAPWWPPDLFCLCAAILQNSGAYSRIIEGVAGTTSGTPISKRAQELKRVGRSWRKTVTPGMVPKKVSTLWSTVFLARSTALSELGSQGAEDCRLALLDLLAIADEACVELGIYKVDACELENLQVFAEDVFVDFMTAPEGATLCREIHPSRARVLPKMHTPQSGLTIRSLSHHLGYCAGSDMHPTWYSLAPRQRSHCLNLMLVPWPVTVDPSQFRATQSWKVSDEVDEGGYGLFTFQPNSGPSTDRIQALLDKAEQKVGPIGGIVFPELAMSENEFNEIAAKFATPDRFIISGIGTQAGTAPGRNEAVMEVVDDKLADSAGEFVHIRIRQKKHHRWKLDKAQIRQYGLGANLHPMATWWEHIELGERQISFVSVRPWLTTTVLICEDLARPDPVGDILRAVGPNLIIALLCDGPQLSSRWPGRYASSFADDPGSSVLTFTNLGMSRLSKSSDPSRDRSGVVALWRDAKTGTTEISCPSGVESIVLNVTAEYHQEWTADGRGDGKNSGYPVLSGYHLIASPDGQKGGTRDDHNLNTGGGDTLPPVETAERSTAAQADKAPRRRREGSSGKAARQSKPAQGKSIAKRLK